jgi:hypothetical protein
MEFDKYNQKYYQSSHKKKRFGKKTLIFFAFSFVLVIVMFSAFYRGGGITGNVIGNINHNNSVEIKTSFSIPEVSLNDEYEEVILHLNKGVIIKIDNKKINLEDNENKIVLKDFKGELQINENNLKKLTGKVSEIKINNLPLTLQQKGKMKVSLLDNSKYSFFEINEGVYIKSVFFVTSGSLSFGEDSLILNSEKIELKNYLGKLTIKDKKLILEGIVENLKIEGSSRKLGLSK